MDLPASIELELSRHDRWTSLMEACNFGHKAIVEILLSVPSLDLEAMNIRGQRADEVATSRGHDQLAVMIQNKRTSRYELCLFYVSYFFVQSFEVIFVKS